MPKKVLQKLQGTNIRTDACFNPFNLINHSKRTLKLRKVNENQLRAINLRITTESLQQRICDSCRLRIQKIKKENEDKNKNDHVETPENKEETSNEESDAKTGSGETSGLSGESAKLVNDRVEHLNKGLSFIGSSPIKKRKLTQKKYSEEKVKKITEVIKKKVFNITDDGPDDLDDDDDDITILRTL
ncbi:hypothetical protein ABEB36_015189 [Hypothenemus hampei]|uniref:Uncharacterized protein n=1 Tax=Hypothenemus hampei TaxID=57062 RepID=A0ABD1E0Y8_HYPHA